MARANKYWLLCLECHRQVGAAMNRYCCCALRPVPASQSLGGCSSGNLPHKWPFAAEILRLLRLCKGSIVPALDQKQHRQAANVPRAGQARAMTASPTDAFTCLPVFKTWCMIMFSHSHT